MFRVGMKVVFVDDSGMAHNAALGYTVPIAGQVYTVRDIGPGIGRPDMIAIRLEEIVNDEGLSSLGYIGEPQWRASRFRPAVERPTSIEVFTSMLTPAPKVREEA